MPMLVPTAQEVQNMGKREREAWAKRMGVTQVQIAETRAELRHCEYVRREATLWERIIGPDPDAAAHREALEAALR